MKLFLTTSWLVVALVFGIGAMHGCEDGEIAREKTVDVDDDQVTTQERTVRETDEGIIIEKKTTERNTTTAACRPRRAPSAKWCRNRKTDGVRARPC